MRSGGEGVAAYILSVDQSTQGTKALIFDQKGAILARADVPHRQIIDSAGWVEHDLEEILQNTIEASRQAAAKAGVDPADIACMGISNQRETCAAWDRETGAPVHNAIVWQCGRAKDICGELERAGWGPAVKERTGINLSPYFSASKLAWLLRNVREAPELSRTGKLCCGTIDSWLVFRLTRERTFKTDYSNASRTQLFNLQRLKWDEEICGAFGINPACLPEVCFSDSCFGSTDLGGFLPRPVPIHGVLGDSHAALFGQGCHRPGMVKATYGTGSSVMMNIGKKPILTKSLATSIAWGMGNTVEYVAEGNINYAGAIVTWLKDDMGLISSSKEVGKLAKAANPEDTTCQVPAFSGLGAPYWSGNAKAMICGMTRLTGKRELAKAAEEAIAMQVADILQLMEEEAGIHVDVLKADGGATRDAYLMQLQSDILGKPVDIPDAEELSAIGAAYCAGIAAGVLSKKDLFPVRSALSYAPKMDDIARQKKCSLWKEAVRLTLHQAEQK